MHGDDMTLKKFLGATVAFFAFTATLSSASATTLHIGCVAPLTCNDNNVVTPITTTNTPKFLFLEDPSKNSGTFYLDVLIPNNVSGAATESFSVSGTNTGNSSVSVTSPVGNWISGDLTDFLGRSTSPPNPLNAWLPTTQTYQPGATGYDVYDFDFGEVDFSANDPSFSSSFAYPEGTIIVGFLQYCATTTKHGTSTTTCDLVSTAQSAAGAIEFTNNTNVPEPATWALLLGGLIGVSTLARYTRRSASKAA